jgi:hypothetical protein
MIGAIGHVVLLVVGYLTSFLFHGTGKNMEELTLWGWLRRDPGAAKAVYLNGERTPVNG